MAKPPIHKDGCIQLVKSSSRTAIVKNRKEKSEVKFRADCRREGQKEWRGNVPLPCDFDSLEEARKRIAQFNSCPSVYTWETRILKITTEVVE